MNDHKKKQRIFFSEKRKKIHFINKDASIKIIDNIKNFEFFVQSKTIASFISIKTEISTEYLNEYILKNNKILCLPVMSKKTKKLVFREYNSKTKLLRGKYGVMEPSNESLEVQPDIILTPCLAFDMFGFRLGYGGGFYDSTLLNLKEKKVKFLSIALAFDDQMVNKVAKDKFDQKINYILTEKQLYKIK